MPAPARIRAPVLAPAPVQSRLCGRRRSAWRWPLQTATCRRTEEGAAARRPRRGRCPAHRCQARAPAPRPPARLATPGWGSIRCHSLGMLCHDLQPFRPGFRLTLPCSSKRGCGGDETRAVELRERATPSAASVWRADAPARLLAAGTGALAAKIECLRVEREAELRAQARPLCFPRSAAPPPPSHSSRKPSTRPSALRAYFETAVGLAACFVSYCKRDTTTKCVIQEFIWHTPGHAF